MEPITKKRRYAHQRLHQSGEEKPPEKKRGITTSPARPSDQWPEVSAEVDWSQVPYGNVIEKIISTGNWEYLQSEASRLYSSTQHVPCSIILTRFASGRQNVVFEISFSNGTYWVARVSLIQDVEIQMPSEVATIKLLLEKNIAISGRTLDNTFALSVPAEHKSKVARQLARYWYELSQVTFDQIGRIWAGPRADDDDLRIISMPWFGARDCEPGFYNIGPFKTSDAYFSSLRHGMNELLRAQNRDVWPQWSKPCQALTNAIPSLIIVPRCRRGRFPLAHMDFHYGNVLLDDDYNVTGIIDWTNAHSVPVEVFAAWGEIMIPPLAPNGAKTARAQFRNMFTNAVKDLESAAGSGSASLTISSLLDSPMLTVVYRWLIAVQKVPYTLQALLVRANMVMRALYGDGATIENYKSVRRNQRKGTRRALGMP